MKVQKEVQFFVFVFFTRGGPAHFKLDFSIKHISRFLIGMLTQ